MQELFLLCIKGHLFSNQKMLMKTTSSLSLPEYALFKNLDILKRENNIISDASVC